MPQKAALARKVSYSEKLNVLLRQKKDFAVRPFGFSGEKWQECMISPYQTVTDSTTKKQMIRDLSKDINGIEFPAEEMAKVISTMIRKDME